MYDRNVNWSFMGKDYNWSQSEWNDTGTKHKMIRLNGWKNWKKRHSAIFNLLFKIKELLLGFWHAVFFNTYSKNSLNEWFICNQNLTHWLIFHLLSTKNR